MVSSLRRTIVVHTSLAMHMARVEAARASSHGIQVLTIDQLAARLAGGFIHPIEEDALHDAVKEALPAVKLGELEDIKLLPGMVRAAVETLQKVWRAGLDLGTLAQNPRLQALRVLEQEVLRRLPTSTKRPTELVEFAKSRIRHAPAMFGPIEVHGHSEMSPCWRSLLVALSEVMTVDWIAEARHVPHWLQGAQVRICGRDAETPDVSLYSCANAQHEVIEAVRWARNLIAGGTARPEDIAIAAASPGEFDDHMMALADEGSLPIHFVHGVKAITRRSGQATAALAEVLVSGLSQEGIRRLFSLLRGINELVSQMPQDWGRVLPPDAPLTTLDRWRRAFAAVAPSSWPEGVDYSPRILELLALLDQRPAAAEAAGEQILSGEAALIWMRALKEGPPEALPVTLATLRLRDERDPAASILWTSAASAASAPRPYTRLIGLNAGIWPRRIVEDRLIPDHIIPLEIIDPLPVAGADRRDFATLKAMVSESLVISYGRRDIDGRLLGKSPLIAGMKETFLNRGRIPEHAATEVDRLLARPEEFSSLPIARSALDCWKDWYRPQATSHDGLIGVAHPRVAKTLARVQSASSLKLLLRDPVGYVWKYALGFREPVPADEPLTLDALTFGNLVHDLLKRCVDLLESQGGFGKAARADIESALIESGKALAGEWETEQPVPPAVIWVANLDAAQALALRALAYRLPKLHGQETWTEVPFGWSDRQQTDGRDLPWDPVCPIEIPGARLRIQGYIDRLDRSADGNAARVIDYKTGAVGKKQAEKIIDGGRELQRCLYAYAVKSLLGKSVTVEAALLYPRAEDGDDMLFPLGDADNTLAQLAEALSVARANIEAGIALPGEDSGGNYNDLSFALPANPSYLARKWPAILERLGDAAKIWEMP